MNSKINQNKVILIILFIFTISYGLFIFNAYKNKQEDIDKIKNTISTKIDNLYLETTKTLLAKQLKHRSNFILYKINSKKKLEAIKNKNRDKIYSLFNIHYESLKKQIDGFAIFQILSPRGKSLLRLHDVDNYGDDLTKSRACIKSIVENPRACDFFEVGKNGLAFRYATPIYDNNHLLGFLELGIKPTVVIKKTKSVFNLNSYFFIKNDHATNKNKESLENSGYTLCQFCSKKDTFITEVSKRYDFSKNQTIEYNGRYYNLIEKRLYNALGQDIGKIVFFQDITLFHSQLQSLIITNGVLFVITLLLVYIILNSYLKNIFKTINKARFLLDNTNDAVYVIDLKDGKVLDINERACLKLGYSRDELLKMKVSDFRKPLNETEQIDWNEHINKLKLNHFITLRAIHIKKSGDEIPIEANLSYIKNQDEEYMIAVARDITEQLYMENKIKKKANELQRLHNVISQSVLYTTSDLNGKITSVSKAFEALSGYKESYLIGKNHSIFKDPNTPKEFYTNMWSALQKNQRFVGELKNFDKQNNPYWIKLIIDPLFDEYGKKVGYNSYRENITDKKELEYISSHDPLTGIFNRGEFISQLETKLKSAQRYNYQFGLVMFDIDHFKAINDTYGHQTGDDVLVSLSNCIEEHIRKDDVVARWGGEEFVVIANGADTTHLEQLVQKLQKEIEKISFAPVQKVTASFGLTVYKEGDNIESIQKRADDALYMAKEAGRDRYQIL